MTVPLPHSSPVRPDPAKIIVPRKHGQVLVEPGFKALVEALHQKIEIPAGACANLREGARRDFLQAAVDWARVTGAAAPSPDALDKPWIITGHQVEFYHAGVWAKVVASDALARRVPGAVAFDLLVDHDVLDHLGFDVPQKVGDSWKRVMVEWAAATALPADSLVSPTIGQFEEWDAELASHPLTQTDSLAVVLSALRTTAGQENYVPWMSRARAKLEAALDVHVHHVPASLLCRGEAWRAFVQAWIDNAQTWTAAYNHHLAAYRRRQGIKNDHHPMPDLARQTSGSGGGVVYELPFWIYRQGQPRQRLLVEKNNSEFRIHNSQWRGKAIHAGCGENSEFVIRPRALTLTMFTRLFVADLFVHGIGGALYDQITDGLIEELLHTAPSYACVSAAWLLPLGQPLESNDDLAALRAHRHHLQHNPQLAIDPFTALKTDVAERITERKNLIHEIAESLATARRDQTAITVRRDMFQRLHQLNAELHGRAPHILRRLDESMAATLRAREQNKVLLWREFYFALHSLESLQQFIEKIRAT